MSAQGPDCSAARCDSRRSPRRAANVSGLVNIWRTINRLDLTLKKRYTPTNNAALTSQRSGGNGELATAARRRSVCVSGRVRRDHRPAAPLRAESARHAPVRHTPCGPGRRTRSSPPCALTRSRPLPCSMGRRKASFVSHVAQVLWPSLRPSHVVVIDTSACTCSRRSAPRSNRRLARPVSATLHPVARSHRTRFALKALLRAVRPRTFDPFCEFVAIALAFFTPIECQTMFDTAAISSLYSYEKRSGRMVLTKR